MLVSLDPLVALKIVEHCSTFSDSPVSGQLVGVEFENQIDEDEYELVVQVANCFPNIPTDSSRRSHRDHASSVVIPTDYESAMLKHLRSNNIDHGIVGWYLNSFFPLGFLTSHFLESQLAYQKTVENAIFLAVDLVNCQLGGIGLRAYRINPYFAEFVREKRAHIPGSTNEKLLADDTFRFDEILEEIPLIIKCTQLFAAPASKEILLGVGNMSVVKSFCGNIRLSSKAACKNAEAFVGRLAERMNEISEYVVQEQGKVLTGAGKKKRRQEEHHHLGNLFITELTFAKLLMLEYAKYVIQLDSLLKVE